MNREPLRPVTAADLDSFARDGAICLRQVLDADWLALLDGAIERELAAPGPKSYAYQGKGSGRFHGNQEIWQTSDALAQYCLHSPLPALAGALLGAARIRLYFDHLFVKEPGAESPTPWHNDQPYWPVAGRQIVSFWTALEPVTRANGAVEFVRGSHLWDRWFQPEGFADSRTGINTYERNAAYEPRPDIDAARGDYDIACWDLQPGDVLAFHSLTLHGAGGNASARQRRRGYAVRYAGEDVRYDPRPGTSALLHDDSLMPGAPLDGARFPLVWQNPAAAAA